MESWGGPSRIRTLIVALLLVLVLSLPGWSTSKGGEPAAPAVAPSPRVEAPREQRPARPGRGTEGLLFGLAGVVLLALGWAAERPQR